MKTVRRPPYPKWNLGYFPCSSLIPLPLSSRRPSVSFGGFGLNKPLAAQGRRKPPKPDRNDVICTGHSACSPPSCLFLPLSSMLFFTSYILLSRPTG